MIHLGDCCEVMRGLEPASVHAVIVDPPYGLEFMGKEWDKLQTAQWSGEREAWQDEHPADHIGQRMCNMPRYYAGIEAQQWHTGWLTECYRVMMPGAALLAFGGTRTFHRLVCAAEDVGFEVKDTLLWLYGSGFPKAQDLGALIDRQAPRVEMFAPFAEHFRDCREAKGLTQKDIAAHFPSKTGGLTGCVWNWENGANVPTLEQWGILQPMLALSLEWLPLIERIEAEREVVGKHPNPAGSKGNTFPLGQECDITAPATDLAREWDGWKVGGLKPAYEPILFARKPCEGSTTANVLKCGVGAFNADACRVGLDDGVNLNAMQRQHTSPDVKVGGAQPGWEQLTYNNAGRFPPNLLLGDDEAAAMLDEQSGEITASYRPGDRARKNKNSEWAGPELPRDGSHAGLGYGDTGGAARFFPRFRYTAKACRWEREAGLGGERKFMATMGDGVGGREHNESEPAAYTRNPHPTVKPILLMRWLIELVTREGQVILDPLCGSGTTCAAARWLGREAIGIEKEPEYHAIAVAREDWWAKQRGQEYDACQRQWDAESAETPLFKETEDDESP